MQDLRRSTRAIGCGALLSSLAPGVARAGWGEEWGQLVWGGAQALPLLSEWGVALPLALLLLGFALLARRRGTRLPALMVLLVFVPLAALATTISVPHVFVNGTVADADQVNANFDTLVLESNAQDARLGALEVTDAGLAADISALQSSDGLQASSIAALQASDGFQATSIAALQSTDITNIAPGVGLAGGGSSGSVGLSVDTNQIQSRVSGTCPVGSSIRVVDPNGGVTCEADTDTTCGAPGACPTVHGTDFSYPAPEARTAIIGPERMIHRTGGPRSLPVNGNWYVLNSSDALFSTDRHMDAAITEIPEGATVTGISCRVYDSLNTYQVGVNLYECGATSCATKLTTDWCYTGQAGGCIDNVAAITNLTNLVPALTPFVWQSSVNTYHVSYHTSITGGVNCGGGCRFYNCTLAYTVPGPS